MKEIINFFFNFKLNVNRTDDYSFFYFIFNRAPSFFLIALLFFRAFTLTDNPDSLINADSTLLNCMSKLIK